MQSLIRQIRSKRDKLNNRLGKVRSYNAIRSLQAEIAHLDEYLAVLEESA